MSHVFISYDHNHSDFADNLIKKIKEANFETWSDINLNSGEEWRQSIDDAIRNAFALIVVMTPDAQASEYVTYEWAYAWGAKIPVIPIMLVDTSLHPRLSAIQYIDFRNRLRPWNDLIEVLKKEFADSKPLLDNLKDAYDSLDKLSKALNSADLEEAVGAVKKLAQMDLSDSKIRDTLLNTAKHSLFIPVRIDAALALAQDPQFNDPSILPILIRAYPYADKKARITILRIIGLNKDIEGVKLILEALQEKQFQLREEAEIALLQMGNLSLPKLEESLISGDVRQRQNSAIALEVIWKFPLARISKTKCRIQPNGNKKSVAQITSLC